MLQAEKKARQQATEKEKMLQEMEAQFAAVKKDLMEQVAKVQEGKESSLPTGRQPSAKPNISVPPEDEQPLGAAEKMAVFHALGGYEPVKECSSWSELEGRLAHEDLERLRAMFRPVHCRGSLPRTTATMVPKIVVGLKSSMAAFAQR